MEMTEECNEKKDRAMEERKREREKWRGERWC